MSRAICLIASIALLLSRTSTAEFAGPLYQLPFDHALRDAKGMPLFVDDTEIAKTIPRFAEFGGRISTRLSGMTIPQQLFLSFTPTVTGPHQALSNTIDCDKADDADLLTCRAHVEERSR